MPKHLLALNSLILFAVALYINAVFYVDRERSLAFCLFFGLACAAALASLALWLAALFARKPRQNCLTHALLHSYLTMLSALIGVGITTIPFKL